MKCQFQLRYHTVFGESLWVSGNCAELGHSDPGKLVMMEYLNNDYWKLEIDIDVERIVGGQVVYRYYVKTISGELLPERLNSHAIELPASSVGMIKAIDSWNYAGQYENVFYTAPFQQVLLARPDDSQNAITPVPNGYLFKVRAPLLQNDEVVCLLGNVGALQHWNEKAPLRMKLIGEFWTISVPLSVNSTPIAYKYGIYNTREQRFVVFEEGDNRICYESVDETTAVAQDDGFLRVPDKFWRGAGIAIPVFSLRSYNSFGIGEFTDIPLLVDWAKRTGLKLVQLLPINDTTATKIWTDCYPYAAISAFALHPIYLNLAKVAGLEHASMVAGLESRRQELNGLAAVDYEVVLQTKLAFLKEIYEVVGEQCLASEVYLSYFEKNKEWLKPYAAFCCLRDEFGTSDFAQWGKYGVYNEKNVQSFFRKSSLKCKAVGFYCFLQYHLHLQLTGAVEYAHENGIVLKGDIPIGIYRNSVDAWCAPELYNMDMQAGAPPDDFAVAGQNWGFPTYNWKRMQADGFAWWRRRFEQMSHYFDAFRIDHILGFFRIWSIPNHAVQGIMGKFEPCLPVHRFEFDQYQIPFDYDRLCKPFINEIVIRDVFRDLAETVKREYLYTHDFFNYYLKPEFDTQRKVETWFDKQPATKPNDRLRTGLYYLISNVVLFEQEGSNGQQFHFRIAMDQTSAYQSLPGYVKERMWHLYIDYFFRRQDAFWHQEAMKKLPALKEATNMLVCGEDLGMVPNCVPDVMKRLVILSLEIQRMPKQTDREFFHPADAPYLSVVTPSTHDMSTIRGWWEEDRGVTQRFFNNMLHEYDEAPYFCEPWINRAILLQHLHSPAMWSIFQLQDILGMSGKLRRSNPAEERINIPADPHHYWRYRMHLYLEELLSEHDFNEELKTYVKEAGR
ncbi:MAG: 4-alpha-glucanotransferase [Niabella sp.]